MPVRPQSAPRSSLPYPLAVKWADLRVDDPVTRLRREKGEIVAAILAKAKAGPPV